MTTAEKKVVKAARDMIEEPYKHCLLDGRKEKVGNFRVEPPGLFRGRGEHPKTGLLKVSYIVHWFANSILSPFLENEGEIDYWSN